MPDINGIVKGLYSALNSHWIALYIYKYTHQQMKGVWSPSDLPLKNASTSEHLVKKAHYKLTIIIIIIIIHAKTLNRMGENVLKDGMTKFNELCFIVSYISDR